jgi:hypothetical protein
MNIEEYADALNLQLEITRYANQGNRYSARFDGCETKDGPEDGCLTSTYGNGYSAFTAVEDYVKKIKGKILVVSAMGPDRRQYLVPKTLTGLES